ncbi:MAG: class I SAM-dependent methyltransferase [Wenzhouxiangellaceae bacterium]|nr:class I SAM-dependent methyltransferase [Wenzhouxiangellaceae bacterium]
MPAEPDCAAPPACPVCEGLGCAPFLEIEGRQYWRCRECRATFLDPAQCPDPAAERREYDRHRNEPDDPGYRQFLARLTGPMLERLHPGRQGLDFGCGPGPALAAMLAEAGHEMELWDPIYAPDPAVLERTYDFITCTEVVEHMHHPATEFRRLNTLLRPGGLLGVMTQFQTDDARFATWHYRRDPTHVVFYRKSTLEFIAARMGWRCQFPGHNVAIFTKPARTPNGDSSSR